MPKIRNGKKNPLTVILNKPTPPKEIKKKKNDGKK